MPEEEKENGKEKLSAGQLLGRIRDTLSKQGVSFGDRANEVDILQAALDAIQATGEIVASSMRIRMSGRRYGTSRTTIIASAGREYDADGTSGRLCNKKAFIDRALHDDGRTPLTETECESAGV